MNTLSDSTKFGSIDSLRAVWGVMEPSFMSVGRQAAERRRRFLDDALSFGVPNTRHEEWKYTSLRPLLESGFQLAATAGQTSEVSTELVGMVKARLIEGAVPVVFIDGQLIVDLQGRRFLTSRLSKRCEMQSLITIRPGGINGLLS